MQQAHANRAGANHGHRTRRPAGAVPGMHAIGDGFDQRRLRRPQAGSRHRIAARHHHALGKAAGGAKTEHAALRAHVWPGNVRELEHVIARAALLADGDEIVDLGLPTGVAPATRGAASPEAGAAPTVATIDQKGCVYVPHVAWARAETQLVVVNSDAADHNIHGFKTPVGQNSLKETKFNISSEPGSTKDSNADAFLEDAGLYLVKCHIHPWMSAYVLVADHPYYAVTSDKASGDLKPGAFALDRVPPGTYTLVVWKEGMVENGTPALN